MILTFVVFVAHSAYSRKKKDGAGEEGAGDENSQGTILPPLTTGLTG